MISLNAITRGIRPRSVEEEKIYVRKAAGKAGGAVFRHVQTPRMGGKGGMEAGTRFRDLYERGERNG